VELAKGFFTGVAQDSASLILPEQGLVAYDIWLVNWVMNPSVAPPDDILELWVFGLSKRLSDLVTGNISIGGVDMLTSPGVFAMASWITTVRTEGIGIGMPSKVIPFPKPYRVPFAAMITNANGSVNLEAACEVYYDEVTVSSREMAWLRRRTEVIRTS